MLNSQRERRAIERYYCRSQTSTTKLVIIFFGTRMESLPFRVYLQRFDQTPVRISWAPIAATNQRVCGSEVVTTPL
jgi:hypothetical protein